MKQYIIAFDFIAHDGRHMKGKQLIIAGDSAEARNKIIFILKMQYGYKVKFSQTTWIK